MKKVGEKCCSYIWFYVGVRWSQIQTVATFSCWRLLRWLWKRNFNSKKKKKVILCNSFLTFLILVICSASDTDDNHEVLMAGRNHLSIQEFASAIPNHLLLGSLLEHLCFAYESNPARSRMLFKGMYLEIVWQLTAILNILPLVDQTLKYFMISLR